MTSIQITYESSHGPRIALGSKNAAPNSGSTIRGAGTIRVKSDSEIAGGAEM